MLTALAYTTANWGSLAQHQQGYSMLNQVSAGMDDHPGGYTALVCNQAY